MKKILSVFLIICLSAICATTAFADAQVCALGSSVVSSRLIISGITATCTSRYEDVTASVNCATLVWKAYNSEDITLGHLWTFTVIPSDFVERNDFYMVYSTGWGHVNPYVWA